MPSSLTRGTLFQLRLCFLPGSLTVTEFFACVHTGCYRFRIVPFAASLSERWGEGQEIRGSAGGLGKWGSRGRGVVAAVPQDALYVSP